MATLANASLKKVSKVPDGMPFAQLTLELLYSPAWRARSINCIRLIDFLIIRHLQHGGSENGRLVATYDDLVAFGIGRRLIQKSMSEAEALGLIEVHRGGRRGYMNHYSKFRLTFFAERCVGDKGIVYFGAATDEWKRITPEQAAKVASTDPQKFRIDGYDDEPAQGTKVNSYSTRR